MDENAFATEPQFWFPFTKFQPPRPAGALLERSNLEERLRQMTAQGKLTLVAAPAGAGKTVLAASLVGAGLPTAWIGLDERDDELATFIRLLAAALAQYLDDAGQSVATFILNVPDPRPALPQLIPSIVNRLQVPADEPLRLILDDYHVITAEGIHELLSYLLDYLPPSLHIVLVTRHDPPLPLSRLRARGQLSELRLGDLRFAAAETETFCNEINGLGLQSDELSKLQLQTEGWIAGLHLLATVLGNLADEKARNSYVRQMSLSSRTIFALLADEVLAQQPAEIQEFLLQTSILPELTPANCRAVTQNEAAPALLEQAFTRNLFLREVAGDVATGPYRYHDLFAEFLQLRLQHTRMESWRELNRRAAAATTVPDVKLMHLLRAESWEEAADLLETIGVEEAKRRIVRGPLVRAIKALPDEVVARRPWLQFLVGFDYAFSGQMEAAANWLNQAEQLFRQQGDLLGVVDIMTARGMADSFDSEEEITAYRELVASAGAVMRPDHWLSYHAVEEWFAVTYHDWDLLTEHLGAALNLALATEDPGTLTMAALSTGPQMFFNLAGLARIEKFVEHSQQLQREDEWLRTLCTYQLRAYLHFFRGEVSEAERAINITLQLLERIGGRLTWIDDHISWLVLTLALARRAYHRFDSYFASQVERWQSQESSALSYCGFLSLQGRSFWLRRQMAAAEANLAQILAAPAPPAQKEEFALWRLLLSAPLAAAKGDVAAAEGQLREAIALHKIVRHTVLLSEPRLLLATLYSQANRWDAALAELEIALAGIREVGMPGIILQEGEGITPVLERAVKEGMAVELLQPLLAVLQPQPAQAATPIPNSHEHLTARESEVLRLLATGATNKMIAAELFVTERTVKAHVTRILAKLQAATRTEAVTIAGQLGLL